MANLNFIDDWTGQAVTLSIDNKVSWLKTVSASPHSVDICGNKSFKEAAFNVPVIVDTLHSASQIKVAFKANISGDPCDRSLGIDNVEIYIK